MGVIPPQAWLAVDLFWYCYSRVPGLAGWCLQRNGYPRPGGVLAQEASVLWQQRVIEMAFLELQGELGEESAQARQIAQLHQQTLAKGRK